MNNNQNMQRLYRELSKKMGVSEGSLKSAVQKNSVEDLIRSTDSKKADQISEILSDPEKTKMILNSPQAQALLKMLEDNN